MLNMNYKRYMCIICGWIYDEEVGCEISHLKEGTKWKDIPETWYCPDCGASKEDFEMMEI